MKNAILLHGKPSKEEYYDPSQPSASNAHWFPWLQKQLLVHDIEAKTPEVPYAYDPRWELWVKEVEQFEIGPETTLVGHSCGGGFWVKYLSLNKQLKVGRVILVAPSLGKSWGDGGENFFNDFEIESTLARRTKGLTIIGSNNDGAGIIEAVSELRSKIHDINYIELPGQGHFTLQSMGKNEFPELLKECLAGDT